MDETTAAGFMRLQAWLSPAFPVGGFSYSHGLESAIGDGLVTDQASLGEWIGALIGFGSGWNDAVLFAEAWRRGSGGTSVADLAELGAALASCAERHAETTLQGAAFAGAATLGWPTGLAVALPDSCPYPVAIGALAGGSGVPLEPALAAFLQAFATNLTQVAIRLGATGQTGAVAIVAAMESVILDAARRAAASTPDDLGTATVLSDIAAMRHETRHTRLFRS